MSRKIIVLGTNGQLASCLKSLKGDRDIHFIGSNELNFLDIEKSAELLNSLEAKWIINTTAYTAVDKAESDVANATAINTIAPNNLAKVCKQKNISLIHISTDFVFDGKKTQPYIETDPTNPINVYGKTKLQGENAIFSINPNAYIFRTSWLYSKYGNNFVKTILRLLKEKETLNIIWDQIGTPTHALDLAKEILHITDNNMTPTDTTLFHYSNEGVASWYDFAKAIARYVKVEKQITPLLSKEYPTAAQRPAYSVLNKAKYTSQLQRNIPHWMESLENCIKQISPNE